MFDVSGSLASEQLPAAVTSAQYNSNNQLTQWGATQMTFPKDPFMKQRWKYPRGNWKKRLHNYLVELIEDKPTKRHLKSNPR